MKGIALILAAAAASAAASPVVSFAASHRSEPSSRPRDSSMHIRPSEQNAVERWASSALETV